MKYVYPAIFSPEENGQYSVRFPDLDGCYTGGDNMADAIEMAQDALCLFLYHEEVDKREIKKASDMKSVKTEEGETVSLIACDTMEYRKYFGKQAVRKTVTLPAWLNTMAEDADISFSSVLQNALKEKLGLNTQSQQPQ